MARCIALARLGNGWVAPNPMVGAVLVHNDTIIGEGYHAQYGQAHAEVNCINAVAPENIHLISRSTLYVSLEPCAHFGKTPPCADLIIRHRIPKVVVGCRDPFKEVNGKGIERLRAAGIEVITPVLEAACREINKRFFCFHTLERPYIILKWAQTANGFIGNTGNERLFISNAQTNILVHKWRSEEAAVLVGTNTALIDNPSLTNRLWTGRHPLRVVLDRKLRLPMQLQLFDNQLPTLVLNEVKASHSENLSFSLLGHEATMPKKIAAALYRSNIQSVLVEGGAQLLQSFIDEGCYDEIRVITNTGLMVQNGIKAPVLNNSKLIDTTTILTDTIQFYRK